MIDDRLEIRSPARCKYQNCFFQFRNPYFTSAEMSLRWRSPRHDIKLTPSYAFFAAKLFVGPMPVTERTLPPLVKKELSFTTVPEWKTNIRSKAFAAAIPWISYPVLGFSGYPSEHITTVHEESLLHFKSASSISPSELWAIRSLRRSESNLGKIAWVSGFAQPYVKLKNFWRVIFVKHQSQIQKSSKF